MKVNYLGIKTSEVKIEGNEENYFIWGLNRTIFIKVLYLYRNIKRPIDIVQYLKTLNLDKFGL